jgi:hypothetical protein
MEIVSNLNPGIKNNDESKISKIAMRKPLGVYKVWKLKFIKQSLSSKIPVDMNSLFMKLYVTYLRNLK